MNADHLHDDLPIASLCPRMCARGVGIGELMCTGLEAVYEQAIRVASLLTTGVAFRIDHRAP